jgi:molybdopterin-guanine dinucleotide biosynthesis protein A
MNTAGIVLCGGRSRRMGQSKLSLPFGDETMLARVVRRVGEVVEPVVVVAAIGQELPELPPGVLVARDRQEGRGPLEGLAVGLTALGDRADAAFVCACDLPLLVPGFIRRAIQLAEGYDLAIPYLNGLYEPLAAVYRTSVLPEVESLLAAGRLRPIYLLDAVRTRRIAPEELAGVDPDLLSLANVNSPADYQAALTRAGIDPAGQRGTGPPDVSPRNTELPERGTPRRGR